MTFETKHSDLIHAWTRQTAAVREYRVLLRARARDTSTSRDEEKMCVWIEIDIYVKKCMCTHFNETCVV